MDEISVRTTDESNTTAKRPKTKTEIDPSSLFKRFSDLVELRARISDLVELRARISDLVELRVRISDLVELRVRERDRIGFSSFVKPKVRPFLGQ